MKENYRDVFRKAGAAMKAALVERDDEVDAMLACLVARKHCLFVGPPGEAKSLMARNLAGLFGGGYQEYLLTKFTDPSEILGPVNLEALKRGEFDRCSDGFAPDANVLVLDEIWKASSAILNCTLGLLNERVVRFGKKVVKVPLAMAVGLSNEYPNETEAAEVNALFDRFLVRMEVKPVSSQDGFLRVATAHESSFFPKFEATATRDDLEKAASEASNLPVSKDALDALADVRRRIAAPDVNSRPGSRRWRHSVDLAKARAYLDGDGELKPKHLTVMAHTLWTTPEQAKKVAAAVTKAADPRGFELNNLLAAASEIYDGDTSDLSKAATAVAKLKEILERIKQEPLKSHPKAKDYFTLIQKERSRIYDSSLRRDNGSEF